MDFTPTLNLHKPAINGEDTENVWGYDLNTNFDTIDAAFANLAGDKGDIIVGTNGSLTFDPNIVTAAARTVIAGTTIPVMRTTLGAEAAIAAGTPAQFWRGDKTWQTLGIADIPALQPALNLKAPLADPVFTGNPTAPTPAPGDSDTSIATTAFVTNGLATGLAAKAPLASPAFTGNPTAPTPIAGDNDTSVATTAFVTAAVVAAGGVSPSNANPVMDGVTAPGTSALYARGDHVHPSDTSRVAKTGDTMSGPLSATGITSTGGVIVGGLLTGVSGLIIDNGGAIYFKDAGGTARGTLIASGNNLFLDNQAAGQIIFRTAAVAGSPATALALNPNQTAQFAGSMAAAGITSTAGLAVTAGVVTLENNLGTINFKDNGGTPRNVLTYNAGNSTILDSAGANGTIYFRTATVAGTPLNALVLNSNQSANFSGAVTAGGVITGSDGTKFGAYGAGPAFCGANNKATILCGSFGLQLLNQNGSATLLDITETGAATFPGASLSLGSTSGPVGSGYLSLRSNNGGSNYGSWLIFQDGPVGSAAIASVASGGLQFYTKDNKLCLQLDNGGNAIFGGIANVPGTFSANNGTFVTSSAGNIGRGGAFQHLMKTGSNALSIQGSSTSGVYSGIDFADVNLTQCGGIIVDQAAHTITVMASSDARIKPDFTPIEGAGEIIDALEVGRYTSGDRKVLGVRAQDAHRVVPNAVVPGDDDPDKRIGDEGFEMWGVDYSKFVPALLSEMKALRARVAQLEAAR